MQERNIVMDWHACTNISSFISFLSLSFFLFVNHKRDFHFISFHLIDFCLLGTSSNVCWSSGRHNVVVEQEYDIFNVVFVPLYDHELPFQEVATPRLGPLSFHESL